MGRARRKAARRRTRSAALRSTPPDSPDKNYHQEVDDDRTTADSTDIRDDSTSPRDWFRRSDHSPVASSYLAFAGVLTAPIVGLITGKYVACLQLAAGTARAVLATVIGVPVGLSLGTLAMIVQSLGIPPMRTKRSSRTIRRVIERTAITAVYGTFIAATGTIVAFGVNDQGCSVDLLQTLGNGATWGTLVGLGLSLPTLVRSISTDFIEAKSGNGKIEMIRTLAIGVVLAALTASVYTSRLLQGFGWPK